MQPIGYWSRTVTEPEKKLAMTHKDDLPVVWTIVPLRPYLEGSRFTIRSDHGAFQCLLTMAEAAADLARRPIRLLDFDLYILHRAGMKNQISDALSHLKTGGGDASTLGDEASVMNIFEQRQTSNGNSGDSYEDDSNKQYKVTNNAFPYVPAVLALTAVNKEHTRTLRQLLKDQHLNLKCR